jgi:hypothetical protein
MEMFLTADILAMDVTCYLSAARGTNGPIISDSGGVSKIEDRTISFVSPISTTDELATPIIRITPTDNCLFST